MMGTPLGETAIEAGKEYAKSRISAEQIAQLPLRGKALHREILNRKAINGTVQFLLNDKFLRRVGFLADFSTEFAEQMHSLQELNLDNARRGTEIARKGLYAAAKAGVLYKMEPIVYENLAQYIQPLVHKTLSYVAQRVGMRLHPVISTAVTVYATGTILHRFWDAQETTTPSSLPKFTPSPTISPSAADLMRTLQAMPGDRKNAAQVSVTPLMFAMPQTKLKENKANRPRNLPSLQSSHNTKAAQTLDVKRDVIKGNSNVAQTERVDTKKIAQTIFSKFSDGAQSKRANFGPLPEYPRNAENQTDYLPRERGRFQMDNHNGKLTGSVMIDPIKAPELAAALFMINLLLSQIKWWRLSESDQALVRFNQEFNQFKEAKAGNLNWNIIWGYIKGNDRNDTAHEHYQHALDFSKKVIDTHSDPKIVAVHQARHFALASGRQDLIVMIDKNENELLKSYAASFKQNVNQAYSQLKTGDPAAANTIAGLKHLFPDRAESFVACAYLHINNKQYHQAHQDVVAAERSYKRSLKMMPTTDHPYLVNLSGEINQLKYVLLYRQFENAAPEHQPKILNSLREHTETCLKNSGEHPIYIGLHVNVLVMSGQTQEAIAWQTKLCDKFPCAEHLYDLGILHQKAKNYTAAGEAFSQALKQQPNEQLRYAIQQSYSELPQPEVVVATTASCNTTHTDVTKAAHQSDLVSSVSNSIPNHSETDLGVNALAARITALNAEPLADEKHNKFFREDSYFSEAKKHFKSVLQLDPKNQVARQHLKDIQQYDSQLLVDYGDALFEKGQYVKAGRQFQAALEINPQCKSASKCLKEFKNNQLGNLGISIILQIFNTPWVQHQLRHNLWTPLHSAVQQGRQTHQFIGDFLNFTKAFKERSLGQLWDFEGFKKEWAKMESPARFSFVATKAVLVTEFLAHRYRHSMSETTYDNIGNVATFVQTLGDATYIYDYLIYKDLSDLSLVLGKYSRLVAGGALIGMRGIDIGEAIYRGGYKLYYKKYAPRPESSEYLLAKHTLTSTATVAWIACSQPAAVSIAANSILAAGKLATVASGIGLVIGLGYYINRAAYHEKLRNLKENADILAKEGEIDKAIIKVRECFLLESILDATIINDIREKIFQYSRIRLNNAIQAITRVEPVPANVPQENRDKPVAVTKQQMKDMVAAYAIHFAEVGRDVELQNKYLELQLKNEMNSGFEEIDRYRNAKEYSKAIIALKELIKKLEQIKPAQAVTDADKSIATMFDEQIQFAKNIIVECKLYNSYKYYLTELFYLNKHEKLLEEYILAFPDAEDKKQELKKLIEQIAIKQQEYVRIPQGNEKIETKAFAFPMPSNPGKNRQGGKKNADIKYEIKSNPALDVSVVPRLLPENKETFFEVDVTGDGSCLFYSVALSYLLPVLRDEKDSEEFAQRCIALFSDKITRADISEVKQFLQPYRGEPCFITTPANNKLETLINTRFRQNIVNYMRPRQNDFEQFLRGDVNYSSYENYLQQMAASHRPRKWGGQPEIITICQILKIRIDVYQPAINNQFKAPRSHGEEFKDTFYLVHTGDHYHYLISRRILNSEKHMSAAAVPKAPSIATAASTFGIFGNPMSAAGARNQEQSIIVPMPLKGSPVFSASNSAKSNKFLKEPTFTIEDVPITEDDARKIPPSNRARLLN